MADTLNDWTLKCPFCGSDELKLEEVRTTDALHKLKVCVDLVQESNSQGVQILSDPHAEESKSWIRVDCRRCENSSFIEFVPEGDTVVLKQTKAEGDTGAPVPTT